MSRKEIPGLGVSSWSQKWDVEEFWKQDRQDLPPELDVGVKEGGNQG